MAYTIDTSELRKLAADLDKEGPRAGADVSAAVKRSAEAVKKAAVEMAPKRTGELAGSIGVDMYGDGRSSGVTAVIGPLARYGLFVEKGTSKMAPQPYMEPAFSAESPKLEQSIADIAAKVLS